MNVQYTHSDIYAFMFVYVCVCCILCSVCVSVDISPYGHGYPSSTIQVGYHLPVPKQFSIFPKQARMEYCLSPRNPIENVPASH